jgi:class 3 adenylate cyclase
LDIRILGPLEVLEEGRVLELGGTKQRAVLAMLALDANRAVSLEQLAEGVWDGRPPESARKALQVYATQLRKVLGKDRLLTKGGGYLLRAEEDELDLARFERLRDAGELNAALALWRGRPLADLAELGFAHAEADRLEELRLACLEHRIERDLAAGRHAELVGELEALARAHPHRERFSAQLMLALYRSGRQAEALEAYQSARTTLVDELGLEPGRELRELHQQLLRQDPALDRPAAARPESRPARLPAPTSSVLRKTVTVLFCDVASSTELGERLDPEALRTVMSRWFAAMRTPIERAGGTVEKFVGDAVMAVFGVPSVHEDDAFRAVRAAVEMRDAAAPLGVPVRIGVNTGEVVTGDGATTLVTGDAVNTAKRLEEAAAPGEILVGAATRRLVANATVLEPTGPVAAKGKREPVEAWRVLDTIADATPYARRLDAPLVGRVRELSLLEEELAAATRDRACRLATVVGPAGVGKSRLAQELLARVDAQLLTARCVPYGDGITFLPLRELFGELTGESNDEIFWEVRRLLEERARDHPLLVCLEDVHWAEPAFLDLIEYIAGWSRGTPILLLCLARPELHDERPRWPGTTIALDALNGDESAALLDELAAEWPIEPAARREIEEAAEGNPLFLEQLVAMVAEGGSDAAIPPTIHALLAARLDRLEPTERAILECAAVAGRDFSRGAVAELSGDDVGATLLSLVRKELVRPELSGAPDEDRFRFRHALIRDAAYSEIPKATRADLHARFARWLERRGAEDELVGYHLEQTARCRLELGEPDDALAERAGALLATAGRRAHARDDMPAARNLLQRALALADLGGGRPPALRGLAAASWALGDIEAASAAIGEAIDAAVRAGDVQQEWYARLERAARVHQLHTAADDLGAVATEAVRVFGSLGDDAGLCRAWRRLALLSYSDGHCADAATQAERSLEHARRAGDDAEVTRTADLFCSALVYGPEPVESATRRCLALLDGSRSRVLEAAVASALAYLAAMQASFDDAHAHAARAAAIYEELGLPLLRAGLAQVVAAVDVLGEDAVAAERELRLGRELFVDAGATPLAGHLAASLARVVLERGRVDEAAGLVELARSSVDDRDLGGFVETRLAAARLAELRGRPDEAAALADEAIARLEGTDTIRLADALAARGRVAEAIALHELKGNVAAAALVTARVAR